MAVTLPDADSYHVRQTIADIAVGASSFAEHVRDSVEDGHWNLARRGRRFHWSWDALAWDGSTAPFVGVDAAKYGTSYVEVFQYLIKTGPGKAATLQLRVLMRADSSAAGSKIKYKVYEASGASVADHDFTVNVGLAWQTASFGALNPLAEYRVVVHLKAAAASAVLLVRHAGWEEEITAAGDLP